MASQPPPSRPWLRLTSIARPVAPPPPPAPQPPPQAPPPPAPAPQPRPTISLPTFRPSAPPPPPPPPPPQEPPPPPPPISAPPRPRPPSFPSEPRTPPRQPVQPPPDVKTIVAPTSPLPASPAKLPSAPPAVTSPPAKAQLPPPAARSPVPSPPKPATSEPPIATPVPVPSPKVVKPGARTPPQSPSMKPVAPPPSPLVLPPPQLRADDQPRFPPEAEQKTVLVQETVPVPPPSSRLPSLNGRFPSDEIPKAGIARDTKNGDAERHRGPHPKKHLDSGEAPGMKVITIAGENKGATMELTRSPKHPPPHHLKASPTSKSNGQESRISTLPGSSSSDEGDGKMKKKDKSHQWKFSTSPPMSAFMNSNVQGVNNSILYNSSCNHHDPGVHLALSRKPSNGALHIKDLVKGHQP
ncbi:hypothetical protein ACJRO7_019073 [Eucalyptus globulus]|uniref:Uncharacterized protein n=1 Tax=Eucalyptus globulus TaxID=34317 RepID=A0ABD3KW12_EUCGL